MKRGFCLIIGIINSWHSLPRPARAAQITGSLWGCGWLGLELNDIWKVNNSWQTITLPSLSIGHTCHVSGYDHMINSLSASRKYRYLYTSTTSKCRKTQVNHQCTRYMLLYFHQPSASTSRYYWSGVLGYDRLLVSAPIFTVLMTLRANYTTTESQ